MNVVKWSESGSGPNVGGSTYSFPLGVRSYHAYSEHIVLFLKKKYEYMAVYSLAHLQNVVYPSNKTFTTV